MKYLKILNPNQASKKTLIDNQNLNFLLKKRFNWMKKYLSGHKRKVIFELGSGSGCIKKILKNKKIILTDVIKFKWINKKINMLRMNLSSTYKKKS
mgnify:CR=1 FL=1